MAKNKIQFQCNNCGYDSPKWMGSCPSCNEWHTFEEVEQKKQSSKKHKVDISDGDSVKPLQLSEISHRAEDRVSTGLQEFDRVLGGGLVKGSFLLLGGDPGIGKSTLMLQLAKSSPDKMILYVAGEESPSQIKQRASRIGLKGEKFLVYANSDIEQVISHAKKLKPDLLVIDSIQTAYSTNLTSLPGSIQQVRECSAMLQQVAKKEEITTLMIGHVTKDGEIAGPKMLEHMVDTVIHFEGDQRQLYRILRGIKNRFGPAQEVGVFEMKNGGLFEVPNPSELFLSETSDNVSGNCITCIMEGSRPILIEVQALVAPGAYSTPQRTANGFDQKRLSMLIAVLEKRGGISLAGQDVYLNIAGGLKISDPSADLAIIAALQSSIKDIPVKSGNIYFGEVGLGGELRRIPFVDMRIREAEKMGVKKAVIPSGKTLNGTKLNVESCDHISQLKI